MSNTLILHAMGRLLKDNPQFTLYGGFGYCALASQLLLQDLWAMRVNSEIIIGEYLTDTANGRHAYTEACKHIESMPVTRNNPYGEIHHSYNERGRRMPFKTGHAVVLHNGHIYDSTSGQFGNPRHYAMDQFLDTWHQVYTATVTVHENDLTLDFGVQSIKKVTAIKNDIAPVKSRTAAENW